MSGNSPATWDPNKMYDMSPEQINAIKKRAEIREKLKAEWQRKVTDPFRKDKIVFDPAIQRFNAMKFTSYESFRPTAKSGLTGFLLLILPTAVLTYDIQRRAKEFDRKCRAGEIKPKDRETKFMY